MQSQFPIRILTNLVQIYLDFRMERMDDVFDWNFMLILKLVKCVCEFDFVPNLTLFLEQV